MNARRAALWAGVGLVLVVAILLAVPDLGRRVRRLVPPAVETPAPAAIGSLATGPVAALGRIEPRNGVRRIAGPPRAAVVIGELLVKEGDRVQKGQPLAVLAETAVQRAEVDRLQAELARAELELSRVRSPIDGQVLKIHAREGERVGPEGIAELGETSAMYAVAEVYETDIGRVRGGEKAKIRSPALPHDLEGEVERIGLEIGKKDVLSTDPVADADARVVEVEIRLLEPELAAALTNLRVEVLIGP
jgi:multidrug efflux pump subunit AcrA (membrane-fusion protein)